MLEVHFLKRDVQCSSRSKEYVSALRSIGQAWIGLVIRGRTALLCTDEGCYGLPLKEINALTLNNSLEREVRGSNGTRLLMGIYKTNPKVDPTFYAKELADGNCMVDETEVCWTRCWGGILHTWCSRREWLVYRYIHCHEQVSLTSKHPIKST